MKLKEKMIKGQKKLFVFMMVITIGITCIIGDSYSLLANDESLETPTEEVKEDSSINSDINEEPQQPEVVEEIEEKPQAIKENKEVVEEARTEKRNMSTPKAGVTDQRYFSFNGNTLTGFVNLVPGVSEPAPRDIVIPETYLNTSGETVEILNLGTGAFAGQSAYIDSITMNNNLKTIGANSFQNLGISEIVIPDSVTSIGDYAFNACSSLTSVTLGSGVKTIGNYAFQGTKISEIIIPDSVTSIGGYAFNDISTLTKVTLGSGVKTIGSSAFQGTKISEIIIPDSVTSIGSQAFYNISTLTKVTLGSGVQSIGSTAFQATKISEIIIPDSVTSIGDSAFNACSSLTSVTLGSGVKTIDGFAFVGTKISEIVIPDSVTSIGDSAFNACSSLTIVTLGSGVQTIGRFAFVGTKISEIIIPDSVTSIGDSAFNACSSLTSVTLGSGVKTIGASAFQGAKISEIIIPDSVTSIGSQAFYNSSTLTKVTLGSGVQSIGSSAFRGAKISEIIIPDSVTSIGVAAFKGSDGILINISKNFNSVLGKPWGARNAKVKWNDDDAYAGHFYYKEGKIMGIKSEPELGCVSPDSHKGTGKLEIPNEINGEKIVEIDVSAFGYSDYSEVVIPEGIVKIGDTAFAETKISEIIIPDSVTSIGGSAFEDIRTLTKVTLGSGVKTIGASAFKSAKISEIIIPDSVTSIGSQAFYNISTLTKVTLGSGVKTIGVSAFFGAEISEIIIPDSVTSIDNQAFDNISTLTKVTLGSGVKTIGYAAFQGAKISEIIIPDSVTSIVSQAFNACSSLTSVTLGSGVKTIGASAFQGAKISEIIIPDSVTSIGSQAFYNISTLTKVTLGSGVQSIGSSAFEGTKISEIIIPDSVTSIGSQAFYNISTLTKVTLGSGVQTIGVSAFFGAEISEIIIPDSVTNIDASAFKDCSDLSSVTLGSGVKMIGDSAFVGTQITGILIPNSVTIIANNSFDGNLEMIRIDQLRNGAPVRLNEPWGATSASVYYNNEYINMEYVIEKEGHKRYIKYDFRAGDLAGLILTVNNPDGTNVGSVSNSVFSGKYEIDQNGTYKFEALSSENKTFPYTVVIDDIGKVSLEGNDIFIKKSILNAASLDELLSYGDVAGLDIDTNTKLNVSVDKTIDEIKSALQNNGDSIQITVSIQNDIGVNESKVITITLDNTAHSVNYYDGDGLLKSQSVSDGDRAISWNPNKKAAAFDTWFTDKACTTEYNFNKAVTGDIDLYAKWDWFNYNVAYTTGFDDLTIANKTNVTVNDKGLIPDSISKKGYVFKGWDYNGEAITKDTKLEKILKDEVDGSTFTLTASWELLNYNVAYTTGFDDLTIANKTNVTVNDKGLIPDSISKKGYVFKGWDYNGEAITKDTKLEKILKNEVDGSTFTLTASWELLNYNVAYTTGFDDLTIANKTNVTVNDKGLIPDSISKKGYVFKGWDYNGEAITKDTKLEKILKDEVDGSTFTLTASWELLNYNVAYSTGFDDLTIANKTNVTVNDKGLIPDSISKKGYVFKGWDYNGEAITKDTKLEKILKDEVDGSTFTLTASWEKEIYLVNFAFVGNAPISVPSLQNVPYLDKVSTPSVSTHENWVFSGWYQDLACTMSFDFNTSIDKEMTIYGKWTYDKSPEDGGNPVVKPDPSPGEGSGDNSGDSSVEKPDNGNTDLSEPNDKEDSDISTDISGKLDKDQIDKGVSFNDLKKMIQISDKNGKNMDYKISSASYNSNTGKYEVNVVLENGETRKIQIPVEQGADTNKEMHNIDSWMHWLMLVLGLGFALYSLISINKAKHQESVSSRVRAIRYVLGGSCLLLSTLIFLLCICDLSLWLYLTSNAVVIGFLIWFMYQERHLIKK